MGGWTPLRFAFLAVLLVLPAAPARADWLVTHEGTWVETRGAWEVKGKLVVFHTLKGDLSSLRLADVDLEASRRETARAELARKAAEEARKRPPEKKEKKRTALVLTDDKVRHVEGGGAAAGASPQAPPSLTVTSWAHTASPGDGHVVITGTLRNTSGAPASDITLAVQLLDAGGKATATGQAVLTATALGAGEQSGLRVEFPGATTYSDVKFMPQAILAAPAEPAPVPSPAKPPKAEAAPSAASGPAAVSSWKRVDTPGGNGIEIQGTLHNETDNLLANAAVEVQLYNEAGERVASTAGILPSTAIQPRGTVDFRAVFPGVFAFTEVKFVPKGLPLDSVPAAEKPPS